MRKLISVCIPCRNEVDNVQPMAEELIRLLDRISQYDFEIIFIDNCSVDGTQEVLRKICAGDKRVKAILNAKNFPDGSGMHVLFQARGDCIISIPADFQVPVEFVTQMISEWEMGAKVVALLKISGKHDKIRLMRKLYYAMSKRFSNQDMLSGFTGSGLYDKGFIDMCKARNDPLLSIRNMVTRYAVPLITLQYQEMPRRSGKSNHSVSSLVDVAIKRFTRVSDVVPKYAILTGISMGVVSFLIAIYYLIRKLSDWYHFPVGMAPVVIGMFFLGALQLIFIGVIGEYVLLINERQINKPRVIEKERINFDKDPMEKGENNA